MCVEPRLLLNLNEAIRGSSPCTGDSFSHEYKTVVERAVLGVRPLANKLAGVSLMGGSLAGGRLAP